MRLKNEYLTQEIEEFLESITPGAGTDELQESIEQVMELLEDDLLNDSLEEDHAEKIRNHLENLWDLIPTRDQEELEDSFSDIMNDLEFEMNSEGEEFEDEDYEL